MSNTTEHMEKRLWRHINIDDRWLEADTSNLDDIKDSWFEKREKLQNDNKEFEEFLNRLKREHAIETGVIDRTRRYISSIRNLPTCDLGGK